MAIQAVNDTMKVPFRLFLARGCSDSPDASLPHSFLCSHPETAPRERSCSEDQKHLTVIPLHSPTNLHQLQEMTMALQEWMRPRAASSSCKDGSNGSSSSSSSTTTDSSQATCKCKSNCNATHTHTHKHRLSNSCKFLMITSVAAVFLLLPACSSM